MIENESHCQAIPQLYNGSFLNSEGQVILAESERTRTEVWTRVMGYHRPVSAFNPGKQSEHAERVHFTENCAH